MRRAATDVTTNRVALYRKRRSLVAQLVSVLLVLNSAAPALARNPERPHSTNQAPTRDAELRRVARPILDDRVVKEAIRQVVSAQEDEERRRWKSLQVEMMGTPNEFMTVRLRDGSEVSGVVPVIFDDQIVVRVSSGERKLDRRTIQRVTKITSGNREKTATIGALLGMAVAVPAFYYLTGDEHETLTKKSRTWFSIFLGFLAGGTVGGAIGGLAGGGRKTVVVYEAV